MKNYISYPNLNKQKYLFLFIFITLHFTCTYSQVSDLKTYSIRNKSSNKNFAIFQKESRGKPVLLNSLDYTNSQDFVFKNIGNSKLEIKPEFSSLSLSIRKDFILEPGATVPFGTIGTTHVSNVVSVSVDRDYNTDSAIPGDFLSSFYKPIQQQWQLIPIPSEPNTYYIRSVAYQDTMVLYPKTVNSRLILGLSKYMGSEEQKWIITQTTPSLPSNTQLEYFYYKDWSWFSKKLYAKIKWKDNADNEDGYKIYYRRKINGQFGHVTFMDEVGSNVTEYTLDGMISKTTEEHCFFIMPFNKWETVSGDVSKVCGIPTYQPLTPPPPPPPPTQNLVKEINIYNCNVNKQSIRVWVIDHTINSGWIDKGDLNHQYTTAGCPNNNPPLKLIFDNDHIYSITIINRSICGDANPDIAVSNGIHCIEYQLLNFKGNVNGNSYSISID